MAQAQVVDSQCFGSAEISVFRVGWVNLVVKGIKQ